VLSARKKGAADGIKLDLILPNCCTATSDAGLVEALILSFDKMFLER
jgi:hypothetical protein